jgi:hypothetical protein
MGAIILASFFLQKTLRAQGPASPSAAPTPPQQPQEQMDPNVFTTGHRSISDAVREFFDLRSKPVQPIAYTHKVHLAKGLQCVQCHVGVDTGAQAKIPTIDFCMTCHQVIARDNPEIKKMAALFASGQDIEWQRVYNFQPSAHVKFIHGPHVQAGVQCATCHGDMTQQTVAERKVNITMGFCVQCHRQKNVSVDCVTCHY